MSCFNHPFGFRLGSVLLCLATSVFSPAFVCAQSETAAAISGRLTHPAGGPVSYARIQISHGQSGQIGYTRTNREGEFFLRGLNVGGPYTLVAEAEGFPPQILSDLWLGLGETRELKLTLSSAATSTPAPGEPVYRLEKVTITADRAENFAGTSSRLSEEAIDLQPSINQSLNDFARSDPRIVLLDPDFEELSAAGQNPRFNAVLIDGVNMHDLYGVNANGLPSQGNPFAMETVAAVAVDLAPYDAERGGFTGAAIQAVTKSGTNALSGSIYSRYRNEKFRAKHPLTGERDPFTDITHGLTLGGPIRRNEAFYFVAYEYAQRTEPAPSAGFDPDPNELARLIAVARSYGHEPGALTNPGQPKKSDHKYLGKIDWHISSAHQLSLRYSETRGQQPVFSDYSSSGRVSLSGHWYDNTQNLQAFAAHLRSRWKNGWQTELKFAGQDYHSRRDPRTRFPQVRINGVPEADGGAFRGSVFIGADDSSQLNRTDVAYSQLAASGTRLWGKHRITLGAQFERTAFRDQFLQNAYGSYTFASIDTFAAGTPSSYTYQYILPGRRPGADWTLDVWAFHLQDTWRIHPRLQLSLGVRAELVATPDRPQENPLVAATFGHRNTETVDGARSIGPRLSFTQKLGSTNRTRLRGGAGVFQGRPPGVWLTNGYANTGLATGLNTRVSGFSPDPDAQFPGTPEARRQLVDLTASNFKLPSVARGNLALEHRFDWQKLSFTMEALRTETIHGLAYENLNLRRTGFGPDGRALYGERTASGNLRSNSYYLSPAFADVYLLKNTSAGHATQVTFELRRPLQGRWAASLSYTRSRALDASPVTASTAATNWATRAAIDPNSTTLGTSNTEIRDRVLAVFTTRLKLLPRSETHISLRYEGRSGRPYSFVFSNDINGDSASYDNDLLYVPAGPSDPRVRFRTPEQRDAFFAYLARTPRLARHAGKIVPRNSERAPFTHRFDLKVVQKFQFTRRLLAEWHADIINLGNLLNSSWGRVEQAAFPYALSVASAVYEPGSNQYIYTFNESSPRRVALQSSASRWQIQSGLRLKF